MTNKDNLTSKQKRAIIAILSTQTIVEAAAMTSVSTRSILRWMKDPDFRAELTKQETEALSVVSRRLVALADIAVKTIKDILNDAEIPAGVKLRASEAVLSNLLRLRELVDLDRRLTELESRVKAK